MDRAKPEPGFYRMRLARGEVPAQIAYEPLDGTWQWSAWIEGRRIADPSKDPHSAGVFRIWHNAEAISAREYQALMRMEIAA
jgi:hypothetical protein